MSSPLILTDLIGGGPYFNQQCIAKEQIHFYHPQTTSVNPVDLILFPTFSRAESRSSDQRQSTAIVCYGMCERSMAHPLSMMKPRRKFLKTSATNQLPLWHLEYVDFS